MSHLVVLSQWVIYDHPKDYPKHYVVRRWDIGRFGVMPDQKAILANSLSEARANLPPGLYRMARYQDDDPAILEVWM